MMCPCSLHKLFSSCCEKFINQSALPSTPEELMRSRYSAYATNNLDYIKQTSHGAALKEFNLHEIQKWNQSITWMNLKILSSSDQWVEFVATYRLKDGTVCDLHELSQFKLIKGRWFYVSGLHPKN